MNFVDFDDFPSVTKKFGSTPKPIYINLIRYPPDRFISHFYFKRNGDNRIQGARMLKKTNKMNYVSEQFKSVY